MSKRWLIRLLLIVTLAVFVSWFIYYTRPAKVVDDALINLANSDSAAFHATISISNPQATQDILGEQASIDLIVDGRFKRVPDRRDDLEAKVQLITKTETVTLTVEGNTRFIDEQTYFKITKAPLAFPALAQLKGLWIKLPRGVQREPSELPQESEIFTQIKKGNRQKIDDMNVTTYHTVATSAAVIHMLDGIVQVLGTHLTADQIANIQQGVASSETIPVDLAISSRPRQIKKISTTTAMPNNNNTITIEFTFSDYNKPFDISVPDGAQTLEEIANSGQEEANKNQ